MASNQRRSSPPYPQATSSKSDTPPHRSSRWPAENTTDPFTAAGQDAASSDKASQDTRRVETAQRGQTAAGNPGKRKKKRNRRPRNRRPSFLAPEGSELGPATGPIPDVTSAPNVAAHRSEPEPPLPFYKLKRDLSSTSLESEALLDHRSQPMMRPRKDSRVAQSFRQSSLSNAPCSGDGGSRNPQSTGTLDEENDSDGSSAVDDRTPLMRPPSDQPSNRTQYGANARSGPLTFRPQRPSGKANSPRLSPRDTTSPLERDYDINNPPSMPGSPQLGPDMNYDDAVVTGRDFDFSLAKSVENRMDPGAHQHDMVIDMESPGGRPELASPEGLRRRRTVNLPVEEDVCFPTEATSELVEDDEPRVPREGTGDRRRRRHRQWPDLSILEDWSREQKEEGGGNFRAKKISEPMLIEGRLRPQYQTWRRDEEIPYRFTYFNEEFQSTIHAQTITELVQLGGSFRELFIPDPPELEESSDDEDVESERPADGHTGNNGRRDISSSANGATPSAHSNGNGNNNNANANFDAHTGGTKQQPRAHSVLSEAMSEARTPTDTSPSRGQQGAKPKRYGPRPTFWLDVLCPTDAEMRVLAKAFGIHALTAEDIMMQEAREKVELFRHYYFINYRTFEQDPNSENYLEPVNMYVVVFREGVLSFHFSQTPHPANVRRRIRQLMDYLLLSSDWISYALIDDITDVFGPLIQAIEDEVDEIDEAILQMHTDRANGDGVTAPLSPGDVLRRVGESRKKVMGMYRLLSNKADVVKGFAKRCNEHWEVAPKSEIGLYLGDIQDHILTMTSSLTYYETLLSRAHSNYLAQINMIMNERQEKTADVLGKLTVLGTIVLPMNIICGMWGMNVKVPGQEVDNLYWFWSITFGLFLFAVLSFYIAKRVYKIV